ncbi:helix-turn-helix domain-containing protein [Brevundimonas pishanensis]|uniref:helix-turn-helix domain-containing protein n=1 Tax=Brevundimonas pishanensis TaxID=2896315 RepID=UPI001FA6ED80|nr:helix-turn-helix domain-containing protein [Brevundimonas pishanensis]
MKLGTYRRTNNLTLQAMAARVGLASKGRMSRIERGQERCPTDLAIAIDRATDGEVTIADVRPDLRDLCILREQRSA